MTITWSQINNNASGTTYSHDSDYLANYSSRISVSRDGQTMALPNYYNSSVAVTRDGGATWVSSQAPNSELVYDVGCANNGFILLAADSMWKYNWDDDTWKNLFFNGWFETVSCSEDGQYIVTISYQFDNAYYSNDYGETWSFAGSYTGAGGTAINKDGSVMMYTDTDSLVLSMHASYNYGASWTEIWSSPSWVDDARQIAMDDDGTNIVAIYDNPETGLFSTNGGTSWTTKNIVPIGSHPCSSYSGAVDLSCDGTAIVLSHWVNGIWVSDDFGDTWTRRYPTLAESNSLWVITSCISGGYWRWYGAQFIGTSNTDILVTNERYSFLDITVTGGVTSPICFSNDLGITWTYDAYYSGWTIQASWGVASDSTNAIYLIGSNGAIENPCKSTDSGITWTNCTVESGSYGLFHDFEDGVAMSSDGLYMALLTYDYGWLYLSSDTGNSWNKTLMPGQAEGNLGKGTQLGMSYDGSCILVCRSDKVGASLVPMRYVSTDYGSTFTDITSSSYNFSSIAMNEDGSLILGGTFASIYSSTNYGNSFADITSQIISDTGAANVRQDAIKINASGTCLYIPDATSGFLYSSDGGLVWQKISGSELSIIGNDFNNVTCSYNGGKVFLSDDATDIGQLFVSNNYGVEWSSSGSPFSSNYYNTFRKIDSNEVGSKLIGSTYSYVYLGRTTEWKIKSISGIMMENVSKVMAISIDDLKKIAGVEN